MDSQNSAVAVAVLEEAFPGENWRQNHDSFVSPCRHQQMGKLAWMHFQNDQVALVEEYHGGVPCPR